MRFPDISLGPYKRDSTTKPFAELRNFVVRESSSLAAPLASWCRIRALSTTCFQCSGPLGSGSVLARVPFPMLGSDTPFEFYIDNTMRGGGCKP